jgi:hypothetical protein
MKLRSLLSPLMYAAVVIIILPHVFDATAYAQVDAAWVKLTRGPIFEISNEPNGADKSNEVNVPIPLTLLPGIKPEDVTVKLLDVRLGNHYVQGLTEAFTLTDKVVAAQGRGPSISIKVDFSKALAQGTYNLLIEATTASQSSPQLLDLQLSRPVAKLKSEATYIVERVLTPFLKPEVSSLSMTLSESGGLTQVNGLNVTTRDFLGDKGQVIGGTVKWPNPPQQIAPGGTENLTYELDGDFPLGISKGTIEIRSPQLAEPHTIAFEIHTRRASWLILLIIALGLVTGYLLRTLLQQRVKLGEARLQGFDLRDRMRNEADRRPDETFRSKINTAVAKLNTALNERKVDDLATAIVDADTELRAALKQFEDRRNKTQEELDLFEKLVKTGWDIPAEVSSAITDARTSVEGLRARLLSDNVKDVEDALSEIGTKLAINLRDALSKWRGGQKATLDLLDTRFLPNAVSEAVSKDISEAQLLLDQAADLKDSPTLNEMSAVLGAIHKARARLSDLLGKLQQWFRYELVEFLSTLRKTALPDEAALRNLERIATDLLDKLITLKEPEDAATLLTPELLGEVNAAWRDALEKQMKGASFSDEEKLKVSPLLDSRKYLDAARAAFVILEQKRRERTSGARRNSELTAEAKSASIPPADSARASDTLPGSPPTTPHVLRVEYIPAPMEPSRSQTYREVLREKFLLFALSGLGIALVGYLLFQEKFVGTFADMAGIFLWAFGLDVTIDTFVRIAKGTGARSTE